MIIEKSLFKDEGVGGGRPSKDVIEAWIGRDISDEEYNNIFNKKNGKN